MAFLFTPSSSSEIQITKEEFNAFHEIDRKLFIRLTMHLARDPDETSQIMAFWMWLEHNAKITNFIYRALETLPITLLHIMADESCMVLNVIQHEAFPSVLESDIVPHDIPVLQGMIKSGVTLKFFHTNRLSIIQGMSTFFENVCLRAFDDLYITATHYQNIPVDPRITGMQLQTELQSNARRDIQMNNYYDPLVIGRVTFDTPIGTVVPLPPAYSVDETVVHGNLNLDQSHSYMLDPRMALMVPSRGAAQPPLEYLCRGFADAYHLAEAQHGSANAYDVSEAEDDILEKEMVKMFSFMNLDDDVGDKGDTSCVVIGGDQVIQVDEGVPADDRTIFLTFSKGYPISEKEVRDFFTRKYGDIFEDVHMQEVEDQQQPLYARLVIRNVSLILTVLGGQAKAKFSINGKHVWARKYVKKSATGGQGSPKGATSNRS